jgi:hypothetical protein
MDSIAATTMDDIIKMAPVSSIVRAMSGNGLAVWLQSSLKPSKRCDGVLMSRSTAAICEKNESLREEM